jgi:hypothetical protein
MGKIVFCINIHTGELVKREAVLWIRDLCVTDSNADPGGSKTYGSYGSGSGTLVKSHKEVTKQKKSRFFLLIMLDDGRIWIRIRTRD